MSGMDALVEFLQARLAEDHAWAKRQERVAIRTHHVGRRGPHPPDHYARVLADVEAKRQIVEEFTKEAWVIEQGHRTEWTMGGQAARETTLRLLAAVYADHPDYREEWKP